RQHALDRDDLPCLLVDPEVDHTLTAPALIAVVLDGGALAAAELRRDEQGRALQILGLYDDHADHVIARPEPDAAHAGGDTPHLAYVGLVEADRHPLTRGEDHLVVAPRDLDVDQL